MDRDLHAAVLLTHRQDQVLAHEIVGDLIDGFGRDAGLFQVHVFHRMLGRQRLVDLRLRGEFEVNQRLTQAHVLRLGVVEGLLHLGGFDRAPFD